MKKARTGSTPVLFTIGHSTRRLEEFVEILRAHGVRRLVDVRSIPRSRHNPQFNRDTLSHVLRNRRISYRHVKSLGGLRRARPDSTENAGWRNASFRGFADYMQTPEFARALDQLVRFAADRPTAILCAESVPWRCHRSLIADALTVRGVRVRHIFNARNAKRHALTAMARVRGARITYPEGLRS
jgi:uncharacterized protein (DUF488 family)